MPAIERYFASIPPKTTKLLLIRNADPVPIRQLKEQANKIINYEISANKAWRIDFATVYERYIQFLFSNISKSLGLIFRENPRLGRISSHNPKWSLRYLEPDFDLYKNHISIFADTKYKSHLFNFNSQSEVLINEHRHDLHQIAAYCSFEKSTHKLGLLIYPANIYFKNTIRYMNPYNSTTLNISLFGIPITYANISSIQEKIRKDLSTLIKQQLSAVY